MAKENKQSNLKIPAPMIGYVHDTTENAVRTAKCRPTRKTAEYKKTEEEIKAAVEQIKLSRIKPSSN